MPREHVYANVVTVTDGDLPYAAARSALDLANRDVPVTVTFDRDPSWQVLRRRHQLLSQFVDDLDVAHVAGDVGQVLAARLAVLRSALDRLPLADPAPAGYVSPFRAPGHAGEHLPLRVPSTTAGEPEAGPGPDRRVQLRAQLTWTRDHPVVYLELDGWDHERAEAVDLGGPVVELDWPACNKLARKVKVARDQACGTPE